MSELQALGDWLDEIEGTLDRGEALRPALLQGMAQASPELEGLLEYWKGEVQRSYRERECEVLVPSLVRTGYSKRAGPILVLDQAHSLAERALGELSTLSLDPTRRREAARALEGFLRLARLRLDVARESLELVADVTLERARSC